jgi:hypothetical protein
MLHDLIEFCCLLLNKKKWRWKTNFGKAVKALLLASDNTSLKICLDFHLSVSPPIVVSHLLPGFAEELNGFRRSSTAFSSSC